MMKQWKAALIGCRGEGKSACGGFVAAFLFFGITSVHAGTPVPNFNGAWAHNGFDYRKPYLTPAGDVANGVNNAYLQPWATEILTKDHLTEVNGGIVPTAHRTCYPDGIPTVFGNREMQILQTPSEITILFEDDHQWRTIYLVRPHSSHVTPSWYGESVGHFEGDTLVVDTVGIAATPKGLGSGYGTPHTAALHVVERYRFVTDADTPIEGLPGNAHNDGKIDNNDIVPDRKSLRLTLTMEDAGAYRKPWTVTLDYLPITGLNEYACAENNRDFVPLMPKALVPDF